MNRKSFDNDEKICFEKFKDFSEKVNYFVEYQKNPRFSNTDVSGSTIDGRLINVELKNRNLKLLPNGDVSGFTFIDHDVFIEDYKVAELLLDYVHEGLEPLYLNFLHDDIALLWNLAKVKNVRKKKEVNVNNKGYGKMEKCYRMGLYAVDAAIFKNNVLIKKPGDDLTNINLS